MFRKTVATMVMVALIIVLGLTAFPLHAQETNSAKTQEKPGVVEKASDIGGGAVVKHSILPLILIVVGVGALAAILFLVILKTDYNITGSWDVTDTWQGEAPAAPNNITFSGTKTSGNIWITNHEPLSGTYTVDGKNVSFMFTPGAAFTGTFSDNSTMSGTMMNKGWTGTWTAKRTSSATALQNQQKQ